MTPPDNTMLEAELVNTIAVASGHYATPIHGDGLYALTLVVH